VAGAVVVCRIKQVINSDCSALSCKWLSLCAGGLLPGPAGEPGGGCGGAAAGGAGQAAGGVHLGDARQLALGAPAGALPRHGGQVSVASSLHLADLDGTFGLTCDEFALSNPDHLSSTQHTDFIAVSRQ